MLSSLQRPDSGNLRAGGAVREVCRSEPTFRRRLLFALALFTGLFLADLFLIGDLAFRDLGHAVIDRAFRASLASLEIPILPAAQPEADDSESSEPMSTEVCPPGELLTPARTRSCITARPAETPAGPRVFTSRSMRLQVVTDLEGKVLWRGMSDTDRGPGSAIASLRPEHGEVPEQWDMGDRPRDVIALRPSIGASPGERQDVGIPKELIDREISELQADLQWKLWAGAGVAVLILLVAFLYVLRLLHRTRLLEAQAQMDDRLAFVGGLAAGLAHEIRNPLNVLSMNLQMLEEEIVGGRGPGAAAASDDARAYLATLQGEIRRLSNLVNNFLSYARPNQMRFESRDLNQVLRDLALLIRPEFERRELALHLDLAPYLPPVDLDEAHLRQAVMNILMNATQILKPGGTVTMSSRVGPEGAALVAIEDDGPGVKPEDRSRIFEVFYSTRGGGTGLGLPIAARILEAHGGSISVESAAGRGARFVLRLPRRHPGGSVEAGRPAPAPAAERS